MAVKQKVSRRGSAIVGLMQIKDNPRIKSIGGYVLNFVLGFAMSGSVIMTDLALFGIGIVGKVRADWSGICCLLGTCIGYIFMGGFDWGIKYIVTITLVFTVAFVFRDTKLIKKAWFMPAAVSLITAVTSLLNTYEFLDNFPSAVSIFTEVVLAGASTYFFSIALAPQKKGSEKTERRQAISLLIFFLLTYIAYINQYYGRYFRGKNFRPTNCAHSRFQGWNALGLRRWNRAWVCDGYGFGEYSLLIDGICLCWAYRRHIRKARKTGVPFELHTGKYCRCALDMVSRNSY